MIVHPRRGAGIVRVVVLLVILALIAAIVAIRSVHVGDDEGVARRGGAHLQTRPRSVVVRDSGEVVAPFVVSDARASSRGWVLLDRSARELLLLSPEGRPEVRIGRHGQGPGELEHPRLAVRRDDGTVAAADAFGRHLDIFPATGDPSRLRIEPGDCPVGDPVGLWAAPDGEWTMVRSCLEGLGRWLEVVLVSEGGRQITADLGPLPGILQDMFVQPLAVELGGQLLVGTTRRTCLSVVSRASGEAGDDFHCLSTPFPIATPDSLVRAKLGRSLGRAAAAGLELTLPDELPSLTDLRSTARGPALRILRDDLSEVWALEEDGALVWAEAPEGVRVWPGSRGWLLTRDELEGLRIWTVPYEEWVDPG